MSPFVKYTIIFVIVLAAIFGIALFVQHGAHFVRVSCICYGCFIGWCCAWYTNRLAAHRMPLE